MSILGESRITNVNCFTFVGTEPKQWSKATREGWNHIVNCFTFVGAKPERWSKATRAGWNKSSLQNTLNGEKL